MSNSLVRAGVAAAVAIYRVLTVAVVKPTARSASTATKQDAEERPQHAEGRGFAQEQPLDLA